MNKVVIGLGSNIEPLKNIESARKILAEKYLVLCESKFVQTKPIGKLDQPDFINGSILIATPVTQNILLAELKEIEISLGRTEAFERYGPRTIDLDIVVWNGEVIDQDFYHRSFLKNSVLEIFPNLKY